jgi:hypothetical protein
MSILKIPRTAKGKKPVYFDPTTDKLITMVTTLMGEVSVMRDRLDSVERLIEKHGLFEQGEIETFEITDSVHRERASRRSAFLSRMLRGVAEDLQNLTGVAAPRPECSPGTSTGESEPEVHLT